MTERQKLIPDASHPIDIAPTNARVVVSRNGRVVADSNRALTLREATIPAVQYIPLDDVDPALLEPTDHSTYCPYKGDASYYSIVDGGDRAANAVWTYHAPHDSVSDIADHVAFYADQVEISIY
ncbi:DUF427 domain-containing protein [Williamsia sterculiae]|uniref:Uncharacterized conserved protein, DUF427 family n=1 Tax=Williamsia sterculiae TaxID=1344003 RepID=A0A1N7FIV7_9NOCA|nr:DUF427 domain-containing protein [Williamsia sterculiae]SIS00220.1 Uncharacterized conserved protein, DUF427 family [Williamsia sterculiae]